MKKIIILSLILLLAGASAYQLMFNSVKTITLSEKEYDWTDTPVSRSANQYYWHQFHQGNYDSIPVILEKLTKAYLDNPKDIRSVIHLAFTHMWAISEHQNGNYNPTIIEHATMAQKYFGEAYLMNPRDTRILSLLSSTKLANGSISNDEGLLKDGYLNALKAIREWESFSSFAFAHTMSRLPHTDEKFQKGLMLMRKLAEGYAEDFDPKSRDTQQKIAKMELLDTSYKSKDRVYYNSWVAPHNIEGFFMAYGDMLVKNGNWDEAEAIYKLAQHADQYKNWDFRDVLEDRITNTRTNVKWFRQQVDRSEKSETNKTILSNTRISCRSCHQMSQKDREGIFNSYDESKLLDKKFYLLQQ